jgi:hypothetical protein
MGLDCSHGAWHGAYSAFMRWRSKLAEVAGLPPLELMDGFFDPKPYGTLYFGQEAGGVWDGKREALQASLPISWDCLQPSPLHELLYHSDCEGEIPAERCGPIADALEALIPLLPDEVAGGHIGHWREQTQTFVDGLRAAAAAGEPLDFH